MVIKLLLIEDSDSINASNNYSDHECDRNDDDDDENDMMAYIEIIVRLAHKQYTWWYTLKQLKIDIHRFHWMLDSSVPLTLTVNYLQAVR